MTIAIEPQPHRQKEEKNRQCDLRTAEGKNLIVPVISPHDGRHRQQGQVLEECFPGGEFDRLTETAAVLYRDERRTQKGKDRKEKHRRQSEDRHQPDTHLAKQHATHHHLGAAQPNRKDHAGRNQIIEPVNREVFVDLDRRSPGIDHLRKARHDEHDGQHQAANSGNQAPGPLRQHRFHHFRTGYIRSFLHFLRRHPALVRSRSHR